MERYLSVFIVSLQEMPLVNSVVKHRPWRISMVGFWLSDMANFVRMVVQHVGPYGGLLAAQS